MKPARTVEGFHWDIWLLMTLQNWIFDFGRPIAAVWIFYTIYISQEILIGQFQIDYVRLYYSIHEIYDNTNSPRNFS